MPGFDEAMREFVSVQSRYSAAGAYDSEPTRVMTGILHRIVDAEGVTVPSTVSGWDLYEDHPDAAAAASALYAAAGKVLQEGRVDPVAVKRWLGIG